MSLVEQWSAAVAEQRGVVAELQGRLRLARRGLREAEKQLVACCLERVAIRVDEEAVPERAGETMRCEHPVTVADAVPMPGGCCEYDSTGCWSQSQREALSDLA